MGFKVDFFPVPGASLTGLGREKSSLHLYNKIKNYVVNRKPQYTILKFGKADLEFGYYFKKYITGKHHLNLDEFSKSLIEPYRSRILDLLGSTNVVVHGIDLPSIFDRNFYAKRTMDIITELQDNTINIALYDKLRALQPSIGYRNKLFIRFNTMLKEMCLDIGCHFIDSSNFFQCNETNMLSEYNQDDLDHHYLTSNYMKSKIITSVINNL